jgi:hypothetical protein
MDGEARTTFRRNRLGFCVLHPPTCAGRSTQIEHVDGTVEPSVFPVQIAPQLVVDGEIKPVAPFAEMRGLAYEAAPGVRAEIRFEGDIFEMEDQRNWTDASYKSYCTPLRLPFPVEVQAGTRIRQAITLRLVGQPPSIQVREDAAPTVTLDAAPPRPLPSIGLGLASHGQPLTATEIVRLQTLRPAHLRADLRLDKPEAAASLRRATAEAEALGCALEIALFVPDDAEAALAKLAQQVAELQPPVGAWLLFRGATRTSDAALVALARRYLAPLLPNAHFGGGTDLFFTELNRYRPPLEGLNLVAYSINPQVHAFDNASLIETLEAQATTVASARALIGALPLAVGPVTLRMRYNPNATGPEPEPLPGELPAAVDVRQMSLFGAAWTLGSLKQLAGSDVQRLTYYETTGQRGVMETATGSPQPELFRSLPGAVFPLYHVLADAGEFAGGQIAPATTSHPLLTDGFTLHAGDHRRTLVANFSPARQTVWLRNAPAQVRVTLLDEENVEQAMTAPEQFRVQPGSEQQASDGVLQLHLRPYAVARLDWR